MRRLAYLCLNITREGQASYAHVYEIVNGLRALEWQVDLWEPGFAQAARPPRAIYRLLEFIRVQIRLARTLNEVDALYVRCHFAAFPVCLWARMKGKPVVQEVNGSHESIFISHPITRAASLLIKGLIRTQLSWASAVITVTPQLKEWVEREAKHKAVHVVPNGANISMFTPDAKTHHRLPQPYVLFFGLLAPWQGISTILQAVELSEWPAEVNLVVIGDGQERSAVEEAAGRNSKISYLGTVPYREVPGIVAGSLASLSPQNNLRGRSNTGLFPLKVFESLACGVPVIVTDFPGQADLVRTHDCGIVIPDDSPQALAQAVTTLYRCPEQREAMNARGLTFVRREGSWEYRAKQTSDILGTTLHDFHKKEGLSGSLSG